MQSLELEIFGLSSDLKVCHPSSLWKWCAEKTTWTSISPSASPSKGLFLVKDNTEILGKFHTKKSCQINIFFGFRCVYVPPSTGQTFFSFRIAYARCGTKPDLHGQFYENTVVVQYDKDLLEVSR